MWIKVTKESYEKVIHTCWSCTSNSQRKSEHQSSDPMVGMTCQRFFVDSIGLQGEHLFTSSARQSHQAVKVLCQIPPGFVTSHFFQFIRYLDILSKRMFCWLVVVKPKLWFQMIIFHFYPWERFTILTNIFQLGCNHHLLNILRSILVENCHYVIQ